jgi:hypothetical protein
MNNFDRVLHILQDDYWSLLTPEILKESATITRYKNYQFTIYPEPLGNPSFHVQYKDEWEIVLELFTFKILEVKFGKFKKGSYLPKKIYKEIIEALSRENSIKVLIWHYMLQIWNDNNPNYQVDVDTKIPKL